MTDSIVRLSAAVCAAVAASLTSTPAVPASTLSTNNDPPAITELEVIRTALLLQAGTAAAAALPDQKANTRLAQWWRNWANFWRNF
jgi:phage tail sheath gpL-like